MEQTSSAFQLFYSYAHEDKRWCKELDKHLTLLKREGLLTSWQDRDISVGAEWQCEIDHHLNDAQIILLLISSDFLASDYCYSLEMKRALELHEAGKAVVIPIILRPVDWQSAPFGTLLALPGEGKAITTWANRDLAFAQIARGIRKTILQLRTPLLQDKFPTAVAQPLWMVPHRRNPLFTGQNELLKRLDTAFHGTDAGMSSPVLALSGLGGIGKTQIAIEYAYQYQDRYQAVFWLNAANRDTLLADFVALAHFLSLPARNANDQNLALNAVKRWLAEHHQWLCILDNADHLDLLDSFLPLRHHGYVLLTTRTQAVGSMAHNIEVEEMNRAVGTELLFRRAKIFQSGTITPKERACAQEIVALMGGLPLALDQAGAYIEETGCGLTDYLERFKQRQIALLQRRGKVPGDYPASVLTTWSLSFQQVEQNHPLAADLLRAFAFLDADAIPEELITRAATELGPVLQPLVADLSLLDEAIGSLRQFSLVHRNRTEKTYSIHRLVQTVLKAEMDQVSQHLWAERIVQSMMKVFPSLEEVTWSQGQRFLPHVHVCIKLIDDYSLAEMDAAKLFYRAGRWLHEHARYKEAETFYQRALNMEERKNDALSLDLAKILDSLTWLDLDQGTYQKAVSSGKRSLAIKQQLFPHQHPEVAATMHILGRVYHAQRNFAQAKICYQQALQLKEQLFGPDDAEIATTLHALAWLDHDQKQYDQAESLLQRALSIRERVLGMSHVSTAITLHQLAWLYHEQQRYTEAEPLYQQALGIKERVIGPSHPFTAITLQAMARFYHDQHLYPQAEVLYQRALAIREEILGPDHPFTAATLHYLAQLYSDQHLSSQAEPLYHRALAIREQALGQNHFLTTTTRHKLAQLYRFQSQHAQAESFYIDTLRERDQMLGRTHPSTIMVAQEYAHLLRALQREDEATVLEEHYRNE